MDVSEIKLTTIDSTPKPVEATNRQAAGSTLILEQPGKSQEGNSKGSGDWTDGVAVNATQPSGGFIPHHTSSSSCCDHCRFCCVSDYNFGCCCCCEDCDGGSCSDCCDACDCGICGDCLTSCNDCCSCM